MMNDGRPYRRNPRQHRNRLLVVLLIAVILGVGAGLLHGLSTQRTSPGATAHAATHRVKALLTGIGAAAPATATATATPQPPVTTCTPGDYQTRSYTDAHGATMTYYLYVPCDYNPHSSYPAILLLHGVGESASSSASAAQNRDIILKQAYVQLWSSTTIQQHWPSFVIVPQTVNGSRWVNVPGSTGPYTLAAQPAQNLTLAHEILAAVIAQYSGIDTTRQYITGISMGGYGVWDAIERWPNQWAAAIPIAGAGDPSHADRLVQLPIWAFHAAHDPSVPVAGTREMIAAIRQAGGNPRYTEFNLATHIIWMDAYSMPDLQHWLFSQERSPHA